METGAHPLRLPAPLQAQIGVIARQSERSEEAVIQEALEHFLDTYRWQQQQVEMAVSEADAGGKFYTSQEVDALIAALKA